MKIAVMWVGMSALVCLMSLNTGCANVRPFTTGSCTGLAYDSNPPTQCEVQTEEGIFEKPMSFREKAAWTIVSAIGGYLAYDMYQDRKGDKATGTTTSGDVNSATINGDNNTIIFGGQNDNSSGM